MKLILTHEVSNLGTAGDVVEVKDGYGRNFLLPRGLATPWTKGAQKQIDQMKAARKAREIASVEDARALRDALQANSVTIEERAGESGRLFGAVSTKEIADAVESQLDKNIDRRTIEIGNPIKSVGEYKVSVKVHPEVQATLDVVVKAAK
ncbi:large subunit ribosomal protein L9 [Bowdeniella nasicola]|uniref:Large ribosomal subunit protein bL9 n=1 Tax=Bowdeniella nasicola TaxID=208480 RepID=A0A1H4CQ92_9ACTO|nr:50S ribosomal protein L9 [Bowdeniella nasicola]SEA62272.1 large subunit ribosomal protein L9 [Bowdeniella nasicola]